MTGHDLFLAWREIVGGTEEWDHVPAYEQAYWYKFADFLNTREEAHGPTEDGSVRAVGEGS